MATQDNQCSGEAVQEDTAVPDQLHLLTPPQSRTVGSKRKSHAVPPMSSAVDVQALHDLVQQQSQMLTSFIEQQRSINETLLNMARTGTTTINTEAGELAGNSVAGHNVGSPTLNSRNLVSHYPPTTSTPYRAEMRGNIFPRSETITSNSNMVMPSGNAPPQPNVSSSEEWKRVALALTGKSGALGTIEKPKFKSNESHNPLIFLNRFEKYFKSLGIPIEEKLDVVKGCLSYQAEDWATIHEASWTSYEQFAQDFLAYFWSEERQLVERARILKFRYLNDHRMSMADFFMRQVNRFRCFTPCMSEGSIINEVMRQFPTHIQSLWGACHNRTFAGAIEFLERQGTVVTKKSRNDTPYDPPTVAVVDRYHYQRVPRSTLSDAPPTNATMVAQSFSVPPPPICRCCQGKNMPGNEMRKN